MTDPDAAGEPTALRAEPGPAVELPAPDPVNGLRLYLLLITENTARRRVETVRFQDNGRVRRSVSLDYAIPPELMITTGADADADDDREPDSFIAPLALMQKAPLAMLDVQDETGRSLPVLSTSENSAFAYHALVAAATTAGKQFGFATAVEGMLRDLFRIASEPPAPALAALQRLVDSPDSRVRAIATEPAVRKLATDLALNFVLLAEVEHSQGRRRITKFSYTTKSSADSSYRAGRDTGDAIRNAVLRPNIRTLTFVCPGVGDADSYHFQFEPPTGVVVTRCDLVVAPLQLPNGQRSAPPPIIGEVEGGVGHVHASLPDPEARGSVIVEVSASSHGLVASAGVASGLILAVALALLVLQSTGLINVAEARDWSSILLAIPAIAAGFLVNQTESGLVSRLITPVRITLVVSGLVSFGLAVVIGTMASRTAILMPALWATAIVCGACFAWLAVWWRRCRWALRVAGVD